MWDEPRSALPRGRYGMRITAILAVFRMASADLWRRWMIAIPPALFILVLLTQLPRVEFIARLAQDSETQQKAASEFASLVTLLYGQNLVWGSLLALVLGTAVLGTHKSRAALPTVLGRSVSRADVLAARYAANAVPIMIFWLVPALANEMLAVRIAAPVRVSPVAYVAPLCFHLLLLAMGTWLGAIFSSVPATMAGIFIGILFLNLDSALGSVNDYLRWVGQVTRFFIPPAGRLLEAAAPFSSIAVLGARAGLFLQSIMWIAIFLILATMRFEKIDLTARDD